MDQISKYRVNRCGATGPGIDSEWSGLWLMRGSPDEQVLCRVASFPLHADDL